MNGVFKYTTDTPGNKCVYVLFASTCACTMVQIRHSLLNEVCMLSTDLQSIGQNTNTWFYGTICVLTVTKCSYFSVALSKWILRLKTLKNYLLLKL